MDKFSENPREVILEGAKAIALEQGISAINIRAVASRCKISVGTVYNSFSTKGELLVAVVEDFWREAFNDSDKCLRGDKNIFEKIELLYNNLFIYLGKFQENWIEQLSLLSSSGKSLGRKREHEFFEKVRKSIVNLLDSEEIISNETWNNDLTKEGMAKFIFNNMLAMLKAREENITFFIEILKRIIYLK